MFPELPANLSDLSDDELDALRTQYLAVARQVKAGDEETIGELSAEEVLAEMTSGVDALEQIKAEIQSRVDAEQAYSTSVEELAARAGLDDEPTETLEHEDPGDEQPEEPAEETAPQPEAVQAAARPVRRPLPAARRNRPQATDRSTTPALRASTMLPGLSQPGEIVDRARLGELMSQAIKQNRVQPGMKLVVASASFPFEEDRQLDIRNIGINLERISKVNSPSALLASGGLCSPPTPIYELNGIESAARPVRDALANFQAVRGGVLVGGNPTLVDYAAATGIVTSANDEAGGTFAVKSCLRIECPQFEEVTVDAIYSCVEAGNLTARAYPELMARIDELVRANQARLADGKLLDEIKGGSTVVTTTDHSSDAGAVWSLVGDILTAAAGQRSRHRLAPDTPLRLLLPAVAADIVAIDIARMGIDKFGQGRAGATAFFASLGINATYYLDEATGSDQIVPAQAPGALEALPDTIEYFLYPEGSWLHLDSGSLDLGIVRDSTLNSTNDFQVFAETWENAAFVGVESLAITTTVCPSGTLAAGEALAGIGC